MNYRLYGQFASKNAVEPVEDRLKASKVIKASDFYPQAMSAFRWGGKQIVHAAERFQPSGLLQQGAVRQVQRARAEGRLDLE